MQIETTRKFPKNFTENTNMLFQGQAFQLSVTQSVGILIFDLQGSAINKIDSDVAHELKEIVEMLKGNSDVKSLCLLSAKKGSFIVGADIEAIKGLKDKSEALEASRLGQDIFSAFEDLKIPKLVAIHGACMGGGTELSMACDYRICSDSSKTMIAVPEVKLGFLPGWGGTYRLYKKLGLAAALDMILTGKNIRAKKALKIALVDYVVPEAKLAEIAFDYSLLLAQGKSLPKKKEIKKALPIKILESNALGRKVILSQAKKGVMKLTRGNYPAPLKIIETFSKYAGLGRDRFMEKEHEAFAELWDTPESKALVGLFFLAEGAKKNSGTNLSSEELKALPKVNNLAVLGAGVMGGGIASQSARKNVPTTLKDINEAGILTGLQHAQKFFDKEFKRRRIDKFEHSRRSARVRGQLDYNGFKSYDLVIEAVVENMNVKKKVFAELEDRIREDTLVGSNTSSLSVEEMATAFKKPERFVGIHFFNPVEKMPLVEVITHSRVAPETVARAVNFSRAIGKTPVVVKDGPGFLVNRLLLPWLVESIYLFEEGYSIQKLDKIMKDFGMPMGPLELIDEIGIDVCAKVVKIIHDAFGKRAEPSAGLAKLNEHNSQADEKRLGRKSGLGFYKWSGAAGKKLEADEEAMRAIIQPGQSSTQKRKLNTEELQQRMIFPMINEAAILLEEGIVASAADVDLGMIFGTGFAPFRGGLLRYADSVGVDHVVSFLELLSKENGERMAPSEALKRVTSFYK